MMLYRGYTTDTIGSDGVSHWIQVGTPRTVGGTPMVTIGHTLVPAAGWHEERSDAVLDVAARIEAMGHTLLAQADTLRAEAAREAAKKAVVTT